MELEGTVSTSLVLDGFALLSSTSGHGSVYFG